MMIRIRCIAFVLQSVLMILFLNSSLYSQYPEGSSPIDGYKFKLLPVPPGVIISDNPFYVIKQDFTVILRDGAILDASRFFPSEPNPNLENGYPCVVLVHGYGGSKAELEDHAAAQSSFSYVVYTYSVRGQGNSGGYSEMISKVEAQDLIEFVNYIKLDHSSGLDSSKIIIMGGSQGGTLPFMATSMGMNVKAIVSGLTSPEFASSWIENGSVKMTLLWSLRYTIDTVRYSSTLTSMKNWIFQSGTRNDKWDSLAYYMPLNRNFMNTVQNNQVPVLIENSWQDYFFNTRQAIESFDVLNSPHRVYFGAVVGHGGDFSETENQWHGNFFNEWFDHYIWGVNNNILIRPKYHFAYTTYPRVNDSWTFKHDSSAVWPPANVNVQTLYMNTNNMITNTPAENENLFASFKNIVTGNLTMTEAAQLQFTGSTFDSKFKKDSVYFETLPLTQQLSMIGTPNLILEYASNADLCQYNIQLFEVSQSGTANFITRINYTDRNYNTNQKKSKEIEGKSHAHIFQAGSKIRVVIKNLDWTPQDYKFLRTNPHVLPVLTNSVNKVFLKGTKLEIPVKDGTTNIFSSNENNIISSFKLHQNYPNPFNPETTIQFEIPAGYNGNIQLKIYDMNGREAATLIDGQMNAGIHNINWNASGYATGVYFYKLSATSGSQNEDQIKKMLLIK